jgi:hypothetical protein
MRDAIKICLSFLALFHAYGERVGAILIVYLQGCESAWKDTVFAKKVRPASFYWFWSWKVWQIIAQFVDDYIKKQLFLVAVALGGLVVIVLAIGPKVRISNPANGDGF